MLQWPAVVVGATNPSDPNWTAFAGLTAVVLTLLLALARLSQSAVRDDVDPPGRLATLDSEADVRHETGRDVAAVVTLDTPGSHDERDDVSTDATDERRLSLADPALELGADDLAVPDGAGPAVAGQRDLSDLSTGALLVNVALTQGVFGGILLAGAWFLDIPSWAFGIAGDASSTGLPALAIGIALGTGLYVLNEFGAASADTMGVEYDERLRSLLAPETATGWLLLFALILPIIAGVEEFIFRAAVIGATSAGFGTSAWALAVVSSLAFALGHGAQGRVGIAVTGTLGFVLAGAFILTGSFLVVFVAHYLVNALEFLVHELLGIEWVDAVS